MHILLNKIQSYKYKGLRGCLRFWLKYLIHDNKGRCLVEEVMTPS